MVNIPLIASPISHQFSNENFAKKLIDVCDCLEVRESSLESDWPNQRLFHFDIDLIHKWDKKIKDYEDVEGMDDKKKAELLRGNRKEIIDRIGYLRHLTLTILNPLIAKGWIRREHIEMPNHASGYRRVNQGPIHMEDLEQEQLTPELIYEGGGIPFEGVRNEDILDRYLPLYGFFSSLNVMKLRLMEKVTELTDENKRLRKDNEILQTIIKDNQIDI